MMSWSAYEASTVLSGVIMLLFAFAVRLPSEDRFWVFIGGAIMIGDGLYVAGQSGGAFYLAVWIFLLPVIAMLYFIKAMIDRGFASDE